MAAEYTVEEVTDALIYLSRARGIEVTNLKIQKLLYYSQAWSLVLFDAPLFETEFEAWVHGPVVPCVFRRFKDCRWQPITEQVDQPNDTQLIGFLNLVLDKYGSLSATQLERLTHREEPWQMARIGYAPDESSSNVISTQSMKDFYRRLAARS